jgi:cytochrome c oxidase cbb3-type subunit 4
VDVLELYAVLKSLWVMWFMGLFIGIVAWAMWPSRRRTLEEHARIPLRGDR